MNNSANKWGADRNSVEWFSLIRPDGIPIWGNVRNVRMQNGNFSISNARLLSGPNTAGVAAFTQFEDELDVSIETFPEHNLGPLILVTPVSDFIPEQEGFSPSSINLEDLILTTPIDYTPHRNAGFGEGKFLMILT